jgi:hypothetical protein
VIEGLRLLPWLQEALKRDREQSGSDSPFQTLADCRKCMETSNQKERQSWGCPYEPKHDRIEAQPWSPASLNSKWDGDPPTVCPGYTTSLPETIECARAWMHWSKSQLETFCGGPPTDQIWQGVELAAQSYGECQVWMVTPKKEGGGGA